MRQLQRIDKRLSAGMNVRNKPHELVISASGDPTVFPMVRDLVAAAPEIPGWKVIAFHPRQPGKVQVVMNGSSLGPDDVWFRGRPRGGKLEAELYVRGLTDENRSQRYRMCSMLLQYALGEYDLATKLTVVA